MVDDGIVVLHDLARLLNLSTLRPGWHKHALKTSGGHGLRPLLQTAAGFTSICARELKQDVVKHRAHDEQYYMHIDSAVPLLKVFFFSQPTALEHGPFLRVRLAPQH